MNAVVTLLASISIALFFVGPFLSARFAVEYLVIKQPARTQSSTEELARSLFFSIPFVALASLLVWIACHKRYVLDSAAVNVMFGTGMFSDRWAAAASFWPVRTVLLVSYLEVAVYVLLVYRAVKLLPSLVQSGEKLSLYYLCTKLTSPYLKSGWDVIAGRILLPPGTKVSADVATKTGRIYMGRLAGVKTSSDGSLVHVELSNPVIRAEVALADPFVLSGTAPRGESYTFRNSFYFVIFASEIANINLRFNDPTETVPESRSPSSGTESGEIRPDDINGEARTVSRRTLDVLTDIDADEREQLLVELGLDDPEDMDR